VLQKRGRGAETREIVLANKTSGALKRPVFGVARHVVDARFILMAAARHVIWPWLVCQCFVYNRSRTLNQF